jgi:hypothetical protein
LFSFELGEVGECFGGGGVDDGQHLVDDLTGLVCEVYQDLSSIRRVGVTLDESSVFEGVKQGGHAGGADQETSGDDVPGEWLACSFEDGERLKRAWRQVCDLASSSV